MGSAGQQIQSEPRPVSAKREVDGEDAARRPAGTQGRGNWRRTFNRWAPLATAAIGMGLVGASLLVHNLAVWYGMIILGLLLIVGGFWYAANPFLTSERRFFALRSEVGEFIDLVRELNRTAIDGTRDEVEQVKSRMYRAVDRMVEVADREGRGG